MPADFVLQIAQNTIQLILLISAPLLLASLVTGLVVSIFQAATQINEMTLSFIPKLIAIFLALLIAGPWMISLWVEYTQRLFNSISTILI